MVLVSKRGNVSYGQKYSQEDSKVSTEILFGSAVKSPVLPSLLPPPSWPVVERSSTEPGCHGWAPQCLCQGEASPLALCWKPAERDKLERSIPESASLRNIYSSPGLRLMTWKITQWLYKKPSCMFWTVQIVPYEFQAFDLWKEIYITHIQCFL